MITIRASNKLLLWMPAQANFESGDRSTAKKQRFYRDLAAQGMNVRVGMGRPTCALAERLLAELLFQNLYVALWSRLTINDVLISLEWFGEAKDEGLLASHLRGLLLVDSPTGDV